MDTGTRGARRAIVVVMILVATAGCISAGPPKTPNQRAVERGLPPSTPGTPTPPERRPIPER